MFGHNLNTSATLPVNFLRSMRHSLESSKNSIISQSSDLARPSTAHWQTDIHETTITSWYMFDLKLCNYWQCLWDWRLISHVIKELMFKIFTQNDTCTQSNWERATRTALLTSGCGSLNLASLVLSLLILLCLLYFLIC